MIAVAGGTNALSDAAALWPSVSIEGVLARQPDVVIVSTATESVQQILANLRTGPGWRTLTAVRDNRVHVVDAGLMNRPGPALIDAVRILADAIHSQRTVR
jgi:iron complex transport system substrate-binding protein